MKVNTKIKADMKHLKKQQKREIKLLKDMDIISTTRKKIHNYNIGDSNYSHKLIQPWHIWEEYNLNPWDADIIKRVLRTKESQSRIMDYEKIKHICDKCISMLKKDTSD